MDSSPESMGSLSSVSSYLTNGYGSFHASLSGDGGGGGSDSGVNFTSLYNLNNGLQAVSLSRLSSNLEQLLLDTEIGFSDVEIIVGGVSVRTHRCILAARSLFFHGLFSKNKGSSGKEEKLKFKIDELLTYGDVGYEAFMIFLNYIYTGKLKLSPMEVSTCVDAACNHEACFPAINFAVELMYASHVFQVPEMVSLWQRRLCSFVEKAQIESIIPIVRVASACQLNHLLTLCTQRIVVSDLDHVSIVKELPVKLVDEITSLRRSAKSEELDAIISKPLINKNARRIHKALDSDDVELVGLLLKEGNITLDEAYAIHYAAAYCDAKIVSELLALQLNPELQDLACVDINLKNERGYTVLHLAAMRREPTIIMKLLTKSAYPLELSRDGRTAVQICRSMTRAKDYYARTEQGQESNKYRLCVDILEREEGRNLSTTDASVSTLAVTEDFHMRLLHLENRVAFARLFFPAEAKLAMELAQTESTSEFAGLSASAKTSGSSSLRQVDLNDTPSVTHRKLQSRTKALLKTVELGRRYFPHCSQVLDRFMEDDLPDLFYLEKGTPDEQKIKRQRFNELKDDVQKAFTKDKAGHDGGTGLPSSPASSTSVKEGAKQKGRRLIK